MSEHEHEHEHDGEHNGEHDAEHDAEHGHDHEPGWFERKKNINGIFYVLLLACIGILIGGEFIDKHSVFEIEGQFPGFYALFGFLAYCAIITGAVMLRTVLKRDEDYYDE
jgi:hypothetical protein